MNGIEFVAQVFQLIRGGQDFGLRVRPTLEVLRAENFDVEAFGAVLREIDRSSEGWRDLARDQLVTRVAAMSPEARARYADKLEHEMTRGPRKGDKKHGDKNDGARSKDCCD